MPFGADGYFFTSLDSVHKGPIHDTMGTHPSAASGSCICTACGVSEKIRPETGRGENGIPAAEAQEAFRPTVHEAPYPGAESLRFAAAIKMWFFLPLASAEA